MFITFEGIEGSGKTTQMRHVAERMPDALVTKEPGGSAVGDRVRAILLDSQSTIEPIAEVFLFAASRRQLVTEVIRPALRSGRTVLCDRYADSTLAYQGYGRGLRLGDLEQLNRFATDGMQPDLIVLLDLPVAVGLARKPGARDRFEVEGELFHARVRDGYYALAKNGGERWLLLDAHRPVQELADLIWERVDEGMSRS